jgi:glycosyltransferase involved in cell wall biosynthesis
VLSPHRSEGYGLTLAEAFLLGVPALATGWSGNMDYMAALPELAITYRLIPVSDSYGVYRDPNQVWADPDIDDAASKLQRLAASPELRAELVARGRAAIQNQTGAWSREMFEATGFTRSAALA